jgi:hypothetical protein
MKSLSVRTVFLLALLLPPLHAANKPYQTGRIVAVQRKSRERILYYVVNTPVTKDDPYYEVSIQFSDIIYDAEYTPRHASDTVPDEWKAGSEIQARVDNRHISVQEPSGVIWNLVIVKRRPAAPEKPPTDSPPGKN